MRHQPRCSLQFSSARLVAPLLLAVFMSACGGTNSPPPPVLSPPTGSERISNGSFEQGATGWTASPAESEGVEVAQPVVGAESLHTGTNGVRFTTAPGAAAISAFEQEFDPAESFTLDFWVRPQAGSSRIGLAADGRRSNVNVSRLVFLNAGDGASQIVFTAWDVNYAFAYPLDVGVWLRVRITVDGKAGVQTLRVGDYHTVTVSAARTDRPAARAIVLGDRQPRLDAYTIPNTNARVTDGLNGSYDYDDISVIGP